ncbi:MAG TPA: hypothetical protein VM529_23950, partial [Gemmata sp.]|nr:hypothetical protein [Gemmata sp.]
GDSLLIRHTATGELDASFDGDGWAAYALAPDRAETFTHVAIDGEGRIVAVGTLDNGYVDPDGFRVVDRDVFAARVQVE